MCCEVVPIFSASYLQLRMQQRWHIVSLTGGRVCLPNIAVGDTIRKNSNAHCTGGIAPSV